MTLNLPEESAWAARCAADGEFKLAARHWTGGLRFRADSTSIALTITDGQAEAGAPTDGREVIEYSTTDEHWQQLTTAVPPRFHNDLQALTASGAPTGRTGDATMHAQYYAAVMRALELLRPEAPVAAPLPPKPEGVMDAPVGRYVHLELDGHDHRIYFEEAGQGIPLLLQHTAGCHGTQWRHLFEVPEITSRFRLIAYDLPYHGKSVPPPTREWWAEPYHLRGDFLRSIPLKLSAALGLDRPVFMGCSVGGLLALDLAAKHPDAFRAVISVEGALDIPNHLDGLDHLWHPQVSNEYKARAMEGLVAPRSPVAYRKETAFVYASGWPPSFLGDLYYYMADYDLRDAAGSIDTSRCAVSILSGEYDYSGTSELGRAAHEAIAGSTWAEMRDVGHFPMSENPEAFIRYLTPVLDSIAGDQEAGSVAAGP